LVLAAKGLLEMNKFLAFLSDRRELALVVLVPVALLIGAIAAFQPLTQTSAFAHYTVREVLTAFASTVVK
jgi:hypothetical protein